MRLRLDQTKSGALIKVTGRDQDAVGPQAQPRIARLPGKAYALGHRPRPDPCPARSGSTSSRRNFAMASSSATRNTEPTLLPSSSAIQQHSRRGSNDLTNCATIGELPLEADVPAVFLGIERAVPLSLTQPMSPGRCGRSTQGARCCGPGRAGVRMCAPLQPAGPAGLPSVRAASRRSGRASARRVARRRRGPPSSTTTGQPADRSATGGGGSARDARSRANPAQIAGVQRQSRAETGRGQLVLAGDLVKHARLGQRECAVQQPFLDTPIFCV